MRAAHRANGEARHLISRHEDLLGYPADASRMIGFCGQVAWAHTEGSKARNLDHDISRPGLFVRPGQQEVGGFEFFDLGNKITIERGLAFSQRSDAPLTLAFSDLYKPRGGMGALTIDAYTARLRSMLVPGVSIDGLVVANDPLSGAPELIYGPLPHLDAMGNIVILDVDPDDEAPLPDDGVASPTGRYRRRPERRPSPVAAAYPLSAGSESRWTWQPYPLLRRLADAVTFRPGRPTSALGS
jgi:hypothetical protein